MESRLKEKTALLIKELGQLKKVAVAFSGGVDSSFLLKIARDALGDNVLAVLAVGAIHPKHETQKARIMASDFGVELLEISNLIDQDSRFAKNPVDRCYLCKRALLSNLIRQAGESGFENVIEGSNLDDRKDFRPGARAVAELGVKSPLVTCGFSKADIREASRELGLSTWDRPSGACLASRFPYGAKINRELLSQVEAAERVLREAGFSQLRVRHYGPLAKIEIPPEEIARFSKEKFRNDMVNKIKNRGFAYVALDLSGYRSGSMNEVLDKGEILKDEKQHPF